MVRSTTRCHHLLRSAGDSPLEPGWHELDPHDGELDLAVLDAIGDEDVVAAITLDEPTDWVTDVGERLRVALRRGELHLFRREELRPHTHPGTSGSSSDDSDDATPLADLAPAEPSEPIAEKPSEPQRPTWIQISVVDCDGKPMPGHLFRLRLSDGTLRSGTLGPTGELRFDDVIAGLCTLVLPTNDESEWDPARVG